MINIKYPNKNQVNFWAKIVGINKVYMTFQRFKNIFFYVNAHLISWSSKAPNIQNLEKYMVKK